VPFYSSWKFTTTFTTTANAVVTTEVYKSHESLANLNLKNYSNNP